MTLNRKPTLKELRLIESLINKASLKLSSDWKNYLLVRPMDDGGMGSLFLFPNEEIITNRMPGEQVSEFEFFDKDGIKVIVSLNIDKEGSLFELDIWKTDFNLLVELPDL